MIVREGNTLTVLSETGSVIYYEPELLNYFLMGETSTLIVGKYNLTFIYRGLEDNGYKIVTDTNYKSTYVFRGMLAVLRKVGMPVIDIYDQDLNLTFRLTQDGKGNWIYIIRKIIPKKLTVKAVKGYSLIGDINGKPFSYSLDTRQLKAISELPSGYTSIEKIVKHLGVGK